MQRIMKKNGIRYNFSQLERSERIEISISYVLKIIIIAAIIVSIIQFNLFFVASSVVILLFSLLPAIIERKFNITLPVEIDLVLTAFIFLHFMLGEIDDYYNKFWWFDLLLHASSGILIGFVGFIVIYFFLYTNRIKEDPFIVVIFSISFSLASGALWEIFEFSLDTIFGFNMQKSGLNDTMSDLIVDFLGACIVGIGAYRYLTKNEAGIIKTLVNRIIQYNIHIQDKIHTKRAKKSSY